MNANHKKYWIIIIGIILSFWQTGYSTDEFHISLDHAQFLGSDNKHYLEIYYSYPENGLQYQKNDNHEFSCAVYFTLNIFQDDSLWANKQWKIENNLTDTTALSESKKHLVDLLRYPIDSGHHYSVSLFARDYNSGKIDSAKVNLLGKNFNQNQLCLSDLLIAMSIEPVGQETDPKFRKRVYDIVPNPNLTFGINLHELFYYFEIYHLTPAISDSQYAIFWQIKDSTGQTVAENADNLEWRPIVHESTREIGQIPIWELDNGNYTLTCEVKFLSGNLNKSESSKKFFIHKDVTIFPSVDMVTRVEQPVFLDGFDEEQIDLEYDQMYALSTKELRKIYENLNSLEAKRNQVYNLWTMAASTVGLPVISFRTKYLQRIKEADEKYKSSFKPGWKTDQGVVFLKYGTPSDIDRHHSESGTKPYEVWRYEHIEGGVIFVFIDRIGLSQYVLIHSTKRGELSDPNWQRYIATNPLDRY